jgi:hypothetical protein
LRAAWNGSRLGLLTVLEREQQISTEKKMQTWTAVEEDALTQLMQVGRMKRMEAIRLYRRCRNNLTRALMIATSDAPTVEEVSRRAAFGETVRLRAAERRQAAFT